MDQEKKINIQLPPAWASDWELVGYLGAGSYSTVYRAVRRDHPGIDAAIKVIAIPGSPVEVDALRAEGFTDMQSQSYYDDVARQYISEIEMMEQLKGTQYIVGIEDYKVVRREDAIGNYIFIRMELLTPLEALMRQRILTETEVLRVGIDICRALELCAAKKILHRDIKPGNIFYNDRMPGYVFYKLGDFGVARSLHALTHGLSTKGTPNYMAPEVFNGKNYDQRADLYSLGITLYRLMNENCLPFAQKNNLSIASREGALGRRMSGEQIPPPSRGSEAACRAILKACEYNPANRYAGPAEMRAALEAALNAKGTAPAPAPAPVREPEPDPDVTIPMRNRPAAPAYPPAPQGPPSAGNAGMPGRTEQERKKAPKTGKKHTGLIIAAALLAAAVIGALVYFLVLRPSGDNGGEPAFPQVTAEITAAPTEVPTAVPTDAPTAVPTAEPTPVPTAVPTAEPTPVPTAVPTAEPTAVPTAAPTAVPTAEPTAAPTAIPTVVPTAVPTAAPAAVPEGLGWTCRECGATHLFEDDVRFCTTCGKTRLCLECGRSMLKGDNFCENCATPAGKWKCSECHELMDGGDNFCTNCRTKRHTPGQ